jgi:hypothetical protein
MKKNIPIITHIFFITALCMNTTILKASSNKTETLDSTIVKSDAEPVLTLEEEYDLRKHEWLHLLKKDAYIRVSGFYMSEDFIRWIFGTMPNKTQLTPEVVNALKQYWNLFLPLSNAIFYIEKLIENTEEKNNLIQCATIAFFESYPNAIIEQSFYEYLVQLGYVKNKNFKNKKGTSAFKENFNKNIYKEAATTNNETRNLAITLLSCYIEEKIQSDYNKNHQDMFLRSLLVIFLKSPAFKDISLPEKKMVFEIIFENFKPCFYEKLQIMGICPNNLSIMKAIEDKKIMLNPFLNDYLKSDINFYLRQLSIARSHYGRTDKSLKEMQTKTLLLSESLLQFIKSNQEHQLLITQNISKEIRCYNKNRMEAYLFIRFEIEKMHNLLLSNVLPTENHFRFMCNELVDCHKFLTHRLTTEFTDIIPSDWNPGYFIFTQPKIEIAAPGDTSVNIPTDLHEDIQIENADKSEISDTNETNQISMQKIDISQTKTDLNSQQIVEEPKIFSIDVSEIEELKKLVTTYKKELNTISNTNQELQRILESTREELNESNTTIKTLEIDSKKTNKEKKANKEKNENLTKEIQQLKNKISSIQNKHHEQIKSFEEENKKMNLEKQSLIGQIKKSSQEIDSLKKLAETYKNENKKLVKKLQKTPQTKEISIVHTHPTKKEQPTIKILKNEQMDHPTESKKAIDESPIKPISEEDISIRLDQSHEMNELQALIYNTNDQIWAMQRILNTRGYMPELIRALETAKSSMNILMNKLIFLLGNNSAFYLHGWIEQMKENICIYTQKFEALYATTFNPIENLSEKDYVAEWIDKFEQLEKTLTATLNQLQAPISQ